MAVKHRANLQRAADRHGVPRAFIVAIWGLESNFGRFQGVRPTVATLATLAYDGRRQALFRDELFAALRILDSGDVQLDALRGSWAGAMGQTQFMPSSYLKWAVDGDGDGRRDIWTSLPDIFASIANYLKEHGWTKGERWGREVRVGDRTAARVAAAVPMRLTGACQATRDMTEARPLVDVARAGRHAEEWLRAAPGRHQRVSGARRHAPLSRVRQLRGAARLQLRPHVRAERRPPRRSHRDTLKGPPPAFAVVRLARSSHGFGAAARLAPCSFSCRLCR